MDITAFSDNNFDAKEWINSTFRSPEAKENKEAFVSSLVMKLQLYVQQVNSALEETSQQVLQNLPRVMRDIETLQQESLVLRENMKVVRAEMTEVDKNTRQSLATLEHIDELKTRLQTAKQALHEADNWSLLAADLEEVFESGDIENMSSRLTKMQQSLNALTSVPDYEERRAQLEGLKNRLEAIASPRLVQAFTSGSIEQSCKYVKVFSNMDRLSQLIKYYHKCQKGALLQRWRALVDVEQDDGIVHLVNACYDAFLVTWNDQVKWCGQVFTSVSTASILVDLFSDTLACLDPSLYSCIDAALKEETDQLGLLLELSRCTQQFASNLEAAVASASQGKALPDEKVLALAQSVYLPWVPYISKYAALEAENLNAKMSSIVLRQDELSETIQALGQSVAKAISVVQDAQKRCIQLSFGYSYSGLIKAIKSYFSSYLEHFHTAVKKLDKQKGDGEDWNMFQMCLTLLQSVGQLLSEVKRLDRDLARALQDTLRSAQKNDSNSFVKYKLLLLNDSGRKEFDALTSSLQEGEEVVLLTSVVSAVEKLCKKVHQTTFAVILAPITVQLALVQSAPAWCAAVSNSNLSLAPDLPDYSYPPQEYITQIGQYMTTLPQHLEPFFMRDNPALTLALTVAVKDATGESADLLLVEVARATCQMYGEKILGISQLSPSACKQLAADIDYLQDVFDDLGLVLSERLCQLQTLLRIPAEEYQTQSSGCSALLVAAVRQMREITTN